MPGLLARLLQIPADEIETELESLRQQKLDIDRQVKVLESLLELPRTVGTVAVGSHSNEEPANDQARSAGDTVPFLREGIMAVLETDPNRPWKLAEIFGEMVKRSWLSDNDSGRNRLQLRVADMAAKGELTKPGYGYFRQCSVSICPNNSVRTPWFSHSSNWPPSACQMFPTTLARSFPTAQLEVTNDEMRAPGPLNGGLLHGVGPAGRGHPIVGAEGWRPGDP